MNAWPGGPAPRLPPWSRLASLLKSPDSSQAGLNAGTQVPPGPSSSHPPCTVVTVRCHGSCVVLCAPFHLKDAKKVLGRVPSDKHANNSFLCKRRRADAKNKVF